MAEGTSDVDISLLQLSTGRLRNKSIVNNNQSVVKGHHNFTKRAGGASFPRHRSSLVSTHTIPKKQLEDLLLQLKPTVSRVIWSYHPTISAEAGYCTKQIRP